jgi:hypothetical protein
VPRLPESTMVLGRKAFAGKQEEIRFKFSISLKNIVPEIDHLKSGAYIRVSRELSNLGV